MGLDPVRTAAASGGHLQRPASDHAAGQRPRPTTRPARPGHDRTGQDGHAHARLRPIPAAASIGTAHGDHLRRCWMPARTKPLPSDVRAVVSGVHDGRHDRTAVRTPHVRSIRPDTVHSTRHAMPNRKRHGQGNGRTARQAFGHPRLPRPRRRPAGTRRAPPVGRAFAAWQQGWLGAWQDCQRDRTHGSDQAKLLDVAPPSKARLGALLSSDDFESSVERTATLHPL
jgi:hypothetical protein